MKKLISLIVLASMLLSALITPLAALDLPLVQNFEMDETYVMGDANLDRSVDGKDALILKTAVAGGGDHKISDDACDFDADSALSAKDSYSMKLLLSGTKTSSDFENGYQLYSLTIGGNDIHDYCIVLPEGTSEDSNIQFAYLNLMQYVEKATGFRIPMCYGTPITEKAIYFNHVDLDSELGRKMGVEGVKYEVKDGNLSIWGTYRGNGYAVFDILEKYVGIRFIANNATFIFKSRTVDIPEGLSVEYVPKITFRYAGQTYGGGDSVKYHYYPHRLNGSQLYQYDSPFYGTKTGPEFINAHSFGYYWAMGTGTMPDESFGTLSERYQYKHDSGILVDEYKWNPCATDTKIYDTIFSGLIDTTLMVMSWGRVYRFEEDLSAMSFSICDNQNYCTCRNCRKIAVTQKEGYSGLFVQMTNKACDDVQEYFPGCKLYMILYDHTVPATIKPHDKIILMYCGTGCDNHILGRDTCYEGGGQLNGSSNKTDLTALPAWGALCKETGAEIWFWVYAVTYHYYLIGCPNIPNIYYNLKWMFDNANVTGVYYEGGGRTYNFETMKAYLAVKMMWEPDMSYERFVSYAKEYLYMWYGDGYEELWEYIEMQTEAGDQCGTCFINNFDRPGDMYSYEYMGENYEYMRELLESAYDKAKNHTQKTRIETLLVSCDFMGLSSLHTEWYLEGTEETKQLYMDRYLWMHNYIKNHNMSIFRDSIYIFPTEVNYEINPMIQFYEHGSRRVNVYP